MIDRSMFRGPMNAGSVPIICGNIYLNVINARFRPATIAEGIGFVRVNADKPNRLGAIRFCNSSGDCDRCINENVWKFGLPTAVAHSGIDPTYQG